MKVSTLRAVKVAGLVGLPLIALLAVALFFTLGNANTDTAEAGFSAGMELTAPAFVEVGEKFSIGIQTNPSPNVEFAGFSANVEVSAGLKYNGSDNCAAEVKVTINSGTPATCLSQVATGGGHLLAVLSQVSGTPQRLDQSDPTGASDPIGLANLSYTCNTSGEHTATLTTAPTDPDGASYADTSAGNISVSPDPADVIDITCTEPAGVINITKTDDITGDPLGGTCWEVASVDPSAVQTVVDVVGDDGKGCTGETGALGGDGNGTEGSIEITISGVLRLSNGDTWTVRETQAPAKYAEDFATKSNCDFASENPCAVAVQNTRLDGNLTVNFLQIGGGDVPNEDADGQCVTINPGNVVICENDEGAGDDTASATLALDSYTVTFDEASVLADAHQLFGDVTLPCDLTAESPTCKVTFSFSKGNPQILLDGGAFGNLANIFLTDQAGAKLAPKTCADGTDGAAFDAALQFSPTSLSPKDGSAQVVAAWEIQVRFDPKMVCVNLAEGTYAADVGATCVVVDSKSDFPLDGIALIRCQTLKDNFNASADQALPLVSITVRPQPEVYSIIRANQENGIVTQVLVQDVRLSDAIGHAIKVSSAQDAEVTIRYLEGDVNGSCAVDALDEQTLAFRWGSSLGSLVYNERYDLEPSSSGVTPIKGDGDIDINDIQFVFGRHGSSCNGEQQPAQPPVNPKAQVPPA